MPDIAAILSYVDRKYPNQESEANKITDLDAIHKRIYVHINRLSSNFVIHTDVTIADQLTYLFPTNCLPENVDLLQVSDNSGNVWYQFKYAGIRDYISDGRYWTKNTEGSYALAEFGELIPVNDRGIQIFYYKTPATISIATDIPELDEKYHDLLKYALISELASQGHNPDTEIADFYQRKYDEFMADVQDKLADAISGRPTRRAQAEEDW